MILQATAFHSGSMLPLLQDSLRLGELLGYIGPGAGLSAVGAFLAVIAAVFVALFGFVWYPVKRLLRKRRKADEARPVQSTE